MEIPGQAGNDKCGGFRGCPTRRGGSGPSAGSGTFVAEADDGSEGDSSPADHCFILKHSNLAPKRGFFLCLKLFHYGTNRPFFVFGTAFA